MCSLHQDATWDCYIGVGLWSRSRSLLLNIEIQFRSIILVWFCLLTPKLVHATNATKITASFFLTLFFHFLFLSHQYLVESLKTWFRRIASLFELKFCYARLVVICSCLYLMFVCSSVRPSVNSFVSDQIFVTDE